MMTKPMQVLRMERVFDAPREVVFDYFTVPELLCTWWGPDGVTTEQVEMNLQAGGVCRWEMRDNDNNRLILHGQIIELNPPERLIMTHQWEGDEQVSTLTMRFIPMGQQTKFHLKQEGISKAIPMKLYDDWWQSTFVYLQSELGNRKRTIDDKWSNDNEFQS